MTRRKRRPVAEDVRDLVGALGVDRALELAESLSGHGGRRPGAGRKPVADPRAARIMVRLTAEELAACEQAAERKGKPVSTWARETLVKAAPRAAKG